MLYYEDPQNKPASPKQFQVLEDMGIETHEDMRYREANYLIRKHKVAGPLCLLHLSRSIP